MADVSHILHHAESSCDAHGVRLTAKRKNVLACLLQSEKAQSAYELIDAMRENYGESVQPTTMYRILDFLESEDLVHKLHVANKFVACSHISCDHRHEVPQFLICSSCDRVAEIGVDKQLMNTLDRSVQKSGYTLTSPRLELHCLCAECAVPAA